MPRALVVEDQLKLRRNLQESLEREGFDVETCGTGEDGFYRATTGNFDVVILDLTLPGRDGLQVLADLRSRGFAAPVLILTARDAVEDRVAGLDSGADDYLVKPFALAELLARVRALLRRNRFGNERYLRCGDVEMDLLARTVVRGHARVELSPREFDLLEYLLRRKNEAVPKEDLARDVWKEPEGVLTNAIEVCMNGLRRKLERAGSPQFVETVRGVGYVVREQK